MPLHPLLLGILGAVLGSFVATLVIRWPAGRSLGGRSACDSCGRTLRAWELVPLASASALRGRCATCGARIDPRHWRIELATAAVGGLSGWAAPGPAGAAAAVFGWLLLTLALLDLAAWWLPDILTGLLAATGLATALLPLDPSLTDRLIGGAAGFALLWLVAAAYRRARGRDGMGGGDPKLFGAIGLWVGWAMLPPILLVACLIGLGVVLFAKLTGRSVTRHDALPLGALLAAAAYPAYLLMLRGSP